MSFFPGFLTPKFSFCILGVPMNFLQFLEFVSKAFQKDFNTIANVLMLVDPQVTFAMGWKHGGMPMEDNFFFGGKYP